MLYCGACGTPYGAGVSVCSRCGQSLSPSTRATGRSNKPVDIIDPRLRAKVPKLAAHSLRSDEHVLASFSSLMHSGGRRGGTSVRTLVLTTQRILLARDTLFTKQLDDIPYRSVSGVSLRSRFLAPTNAILKIPRGTIKVSCRKDDASIIDRIISGGRSGVTLVARDARVAQPAPSASLRVAASATIPGPYAGPLAVFVPGAMGSMDLDTIDPLAFEDLVRQLFERMGYRAALTKASHDGGVDIEVFDPTPIRGGRFLVQCKRYSGVVGAQYVRDLYGVVQHERAMKGILVTTSHFSPDAYGFAAGKPLELIDRPQVETLLHTYGFSAPTPTAGGGPISAQASALVPPVSMHADLAPDADIGHNLVAPARRTGGSWTWLIKFPAYVLAALCMLTAMNGTWAVFWLGLDIVVITLLASNAWRLREKLPVFGSPHKWKSGLGFASLIALLFGGLAALPSASGQSRVAAAPARTPVARVHPIVAHAPHRSSRLTAPARPIHHRIQRPVHRVVRAKPHRQAPGVTLLRTQRQGDLSKWVADIAGFVTSCVHTNTPLNDIAQSGQDPSGQLQTIHDDCAQDADVLAGSWPIPASLGRYNNLQAALLHLKNGTAEEAQAATAALRFATEGQTEAITEQVATNNSNAGTDFDAALTLIHGVEDTLGVQHVPADDDALSTAPSAQ